MKLIIDIPEEAKRHIDTFKGKFLCGDGCDMISAIQNGTPLDDVKEQIEKAKRFYVGTFEDDNPIDYGIGEGFDKAIEILNNIGKESETN